MPTNESTTKFKVDISELKKNISEANRQIRLANAEFKAASAGMDDWSKSADGISAKLEQTDKVLKAQKTILADYAKQLELVEKEYGKNSKEADELRIKVENQKAAVAKSEKEMRNFQKQLDEVNSGEKDAAKSADDLDSSLNDLDKTADKTSGGFTVLKGAIADLVAKGISKAVDGMKQLAKAAYNSWQEYDEGADGIIAATGATGEAAEELISVYKDVQKNIVASSTDIGTAIGEINTRFGLTGETLQKVSEQFLKFAQLNGVDLKTAVDSVQSSMAAWGISTEDTGKMLDLLNKASQDTGTSVDKLADLLVSNAPAFQEMGFSASDAATFIANLDKSGVEVSATLAGMKKALQNAAKDGKPLGEAMSEIEKSIKGAANSTEAITTATELFGAKSGAAIAKAVRDGQVSFAELGTAMSDFEGNVDRTFEETLDAPDKFKLAIQDVKLTMAETAEGIMDEYAPEIEGAFGKLKDTAKTVVGDILPSLFALASGSDDAGKKLTESLGGFIRNLLTDATKMLPKISTILVTLLDSMLSGLLDTSPQIIAALVTVVTIILDRLSELVPKVAEKVVEIVPQIVKALTDAIPVLLSAALSAFRAIVSAIPKIIPEIVKAIPMIVNALVSAIPELIDGVTEILMAIVDAIPLILPPLVQALPTIFRAIGQILIKNMPVILNAVMRLFEAIIDALPEIVVAITEQLPEIVNTIIGVMIGSIDMFIKAAIMIVAALVKATPKILSALWEGFKKEIKAFTDACIVLLTDWLEKIKQYFEPLVTFFADLWNSISQAAAAAWNAVKAVWSIVSGWFRSTVVEPVKTFFSGMWDGLKKGASNAWEGIKAVFSHVTDWFKGTFSKAWQAVKDVFSTGGKVFDGIKEGIVEAFKTVVNAIIRGVNKVVAIPFNAINGMLDTLAAVDIAGFTPFDFLHRLPVPQIPELRKGGVLKKGQVGLLEGDGTEAVVPLENNKAWINATAAALKDALISEGVFRSGATTENVETTYNFYQTNNSPKALSRLEIYRQSKNLLSMKGVT